MGQQQGQVKRFEFFATDAYAAEKGQYVLYTDYATLQAKNAKLVKALEKLTDPNICFNGSEAQIPFSTQGEAIKAFVEARAALAQAKEG